MNRFYLRITIAVAALFVLLFGASAWLTPAPRLLWNASESAPVGLYRIDTNAVPRVGDLVAIMPPAQLAAFFARRQYLPQGVPLLKRIAATRGARVCRSGAFVSVGGVTVARALARDRADRPLPIWQGCRSLHDDEVFVINAAPGSLDSRYFGPLPAAGLIGTAHPVLTRDAPGSRLRLRLSVRDKAER